VRRSRFSVRQIVAVLKQAELGMVVPDLIRKVGISEQTYYRWKKQYGSLQPDQVRELKQLHEENVRLKKLVADLSLDKAILQDVAQKKKVGRPALRKDAVDYMTSHWGISQRRACRLIKQPRSNQHYESRKDPRHDLRQRMREIANTRIRYGYRRVHVLLRREGWSLVSPPDEYSPFGGADDFLDYLEGSSCFHTRTGFEPCSSTSSWTSASA
jgi:putative transposase